MVKQVKFGDWVNDTVVDFQFAGSGLVRRHMSGYWVSGMEMNLIYLSISILVLLIVYLVDLFAYQIFLIDSIHSDNYVEQRDLLDEDRRVIIRTELRFDGERVI